MANTNKSTASTKAASTTSATKKVSSTTQTNKVAAPKTADTSSANNNQAETKRAIDQIQTFPKRRVWPD